MLTSLNGLKNLLKLLNIKKTIFIQNCFFYKFSLDKSSCNFDVNKFITDPWPGNNQFGKNILKNRFFLDDKGYPVDFLESLLGRTKEYSPFVCCFSWIRDLQNMGGHNARKQAGNFILTFISNYRKTKKFWLVCDSWNVKIISERIVNWIFSYSFFASGSSDKIQKEFLSSIFEQFSHLLKISKAVYDPYSKLLTLKAIFFCYCFMKNNQQKNIKKTLKEIEKLSTNCFDTSGMFYTKNPLEHFNVFRSFLEIRFVAKSLNIDLPEIFNERLTNMAACVRFFRLGDGKLGCYKNFTRSLNKIPPTRQIIDTALSVVGSKIKEISIPEYERIFTKNITLLINAKSKAKLTKGLGYFDFEGSIRSDRVILNSEAYAETFGKILKFKKSQTSVSKFLENKNIVFDAKSDFQNKNIKSSYSRKISIPFDKPQINGTETFELNQNFDFAINFELHQDSEIFELSPKSLLITIGKSEYIFSLISNSASEKELIFHKKTDFENPYICILCHCEKPNSVKVEWKMELVK